MSFEDDFFSCSSSSSDLHYSSAQDDDEILLHDQLKLKFYGNMKNLNIVHINAQSVPAHYTDVVSSFDSKFIDAILISESFLKPSLPSTQYCIPGFKLIRNDRLGKGGGGVAIYLRSDIPHKLVDQSPPEYNSFSEHVFIEIVVNHSKILLGVYYSPSLNVNYFSSLEAKLEYLTPLFDHTIILGDFNTCLLKNDARAESLTSLITSVNMHILPLSATHQAPHCNPSLLDLIAVSDVDRVATHGQLAAPFSYHDLIYVSYKVRCPKHKAKLVQLRSFNNINLDSLRFDSNKIDWSPVLNAEVMDDKVANFNKILTTLFDIHAPVKLVKVKHAPVPWLTQALKKVMSKRDKAKRIHRRTPSEENWINYKILRNRCSKLCRNAKRRHIHNSLQNCNSSLMWKFLKTLGLGKLTSQPNISFDLNTKYSLL